MNLSMAVNIIQSAFKTTLILAAPVLVTSLVIGLVVSIFQTTTSIQEQTLSFVPKFVGILLAIVFSISFIFRVLMDFTYNLYSTMSTLAR